MGQNLKNTMVQSFNRLSSSVSMVMGVSSSNSPGAAARRETGTARGAGRGTGKQPVKGPGRSVDNSPAKGKGKKQRQGKARNTGAVSRSN